jgi:hypothetical protein
MPGFTDRKPSKAVPISDAHPTRQTSDESDTAAACSGVHKWFDRANMHPAIQMDQSFMDGKYFGNCHIRFDH